MRIVTEFAHKVRVIHHAWIEMSDGCKLAAKLWIPEGAEENPVPAILEYIPYRKNDFTAVGDQSTHAYFAGYGYASARVDMRGSGDSEGILEDEYLPLEQRDGLEILRWLAAQQWCSGTVGMIGISWGGFNGLQIAAHAPPELGAVVSIGSSVDRYAEDVHYIGGGIHASTMLYWGTNTFGYNARPPDPDVVGESWREIWFERMERTPPFVEEWLSHQRRDEYWQQGSICEDYRKITCPVYMVAGWHDSYRDSVLRYLENGTAPAKGLIGPWGHQYPNNGSPGPAIGFLQECVRFYDRYLKGRQNGLDSEPTLRVYLQDPIRPGMGEGDRPGRWIAHDSWPSTDMRTLLRHPTASGDLAVDPGSESIRTVNSARLVGIGGGRFGGPTPDQNRDDGLSLSFTSAPLEEDLAIVGFARARLELSLDRLAGQVAVRLCDVWPDGASTRITGAVLNLAHHESHEHPEDLEPGRRYQVDLDMKAIAYLCPRGHRLRLSISAGYWPLMWPSPETFDLSLHIGENTVLELSVIDDPEALESCPEHFPRPECAAPAPHQQLPLPGGWPPLGVETRDIATGTDVLITSSRPRDRHVRLLESGLELSEVSRDTFRITEGDPLSACVQSDMHLSLSRGEWMTRIETSSTMTATADHFLVTNELQGYEGDTRVFAKAWYTTIPRDYT
jgi:uncharacterized protein